MPIRRNKKKLINSANVAGYLYDHTLAIRQVQNQESKNFGKNYISGVISIALDTECTNIVDVHYGYTPEYIFNKTKNMEELNLTYKELEEIITKNATVVNSGVDNCFIVKLSPTIEENAFFSERTNSVVSSQRFIGQRLFNSMFITEGALQMIPNRCNFRNHIYITKSIYNEDYEYLDITGYIFDFRKAASQVKFRIKDKNGINFIQGLLDDCPVGEGVLIEISGDYNNHHIKSVQEGGFGAQTYDRIIKEWEVTWADTYPVDMEEEEPILTKDELKQALQDRETKMATIIADKAAQSSGFSAVKQTQQSTVQKGNFVF